MYDLKDKDIKKILKIFAIIIVTVLLLLMMIPILLSNSKIQNIIVGEATKQLSEKLNTKVEVGKVNYKFFNTFDLENLYIQDLQKDTLLFVNHANLNFEFWKIFSKKLEFKSVELDNFNANLILDKEGKTNFQFIIDALKSNKKTPPNSFYEFKFHQIKIENSTFRFTNLAHLAQKDSSLLDPNRIKINSLNGLITVDYFKRDSLQATIKSLSFIEKSGFKLNNLSLALRGVKKGFFSPQIKLEFPHTKLLIDSASIKYDSISNLKDFSNKVIMAAKINRSSINLKDFQAFYHNLKNISKPINIKGSLKGLISSFTLKDFEINYGNAIHLNADVNLNGVQSINETFIYADINKFQVEKNAAQDLVAKLIGSPVILPAELNRLGKVSYKGNISGFFNNLVAYGNISTNVGSLNTDILLQFGNNLKDLHYNGTLRSTNFDLGKMLATTELGKTVFNVNTKGAKLYNKPFVGEISGNVKKILFKDYNYENISLNGNYDGSGFDGHVSVADKNLAVNFNGEVKLEKKQLPVFNFDIAVEHANLNALNLTKKYENSNLSFTGNTNMIGNSLDNLNGFLELNNVSFTNNGKQLDINQLLFESKVGNNNSRFTVSSDIANGIFEGSFKYSTIPQTIATFLSDYLPSLSSTSSKKYTSNYVNIDLNVPDTKKLSDVLELPFTINGNTTVKGYVDDLNHHIKLNVISPYLSFGANQIHNINVDVNNDDNKLNVQGNAGINVKNDLVNLDIKAFALRDSVYSQFSWHNTEPVVYAGEIQAVAKLQREGKFTTANINILPTQVVLSDSIWDMNPSSIKLNADTTLTINGFKFQHKDQFIKVDGLISKRDNDELNVNLNDLELGYIIGLFNLPDITFGGKATGQAKIVSVLKKPMYDADLSVKKATFNDALIGDGIVHSKWNVEKNEMEASGEFFNESKDTVLIANGVYVPKADSLDFLFDGRKTNLGFLQKFLSSVVSNVKGLGTGKVRMYGQAKHIVFSGDVFAENAGFKVDYLQTAYSFSDTVKLRPKSIIFNNITLYDQDKNQAKLDGNLTHDGNFKNMKFDANVRTNNLMALNTKPSDNDLFYGKAYASGTVHLYGDEENTHFDINVASQPNTKFYLSIGSAETANENDFITFVNNNTVAVSDTLKVSNSEKPKANVFLDMEIDVNENANIQLITDPKSGDNLTAMGSGNLRLTYDPNNELRLYGGYTVDKGSYLFTFQNFLSKTFKLDQGSSINWSGDPFHAKLDITAIYAVTASLQDLNNEVLLTSTNRKNVPVNVILKLTNDMMSPTIQFDLDLPSSDEALKYQLKNIINTQQMLNLQVGSLLLTGKFYNPDYTNTTDYGNSLISSTLTPFLNTTLFGQINSAISQITGGSFSFGLNARTDINSATQSQSSEYEGNVYIQPNSRLIINGNVGYRNLDKKMFGDFDIEYLLTPNGKLMLKAFNHTRDVYTLRSEEYVQGAGLMYKETFDSWDDLLKQIWNKTKNKKNDSTTLKNDTVK